MIEALGYHLLPVDELRALERIFGNSHIIRLSDQIANEAIRVRQTSNLTLGDAIIAATALVNDLELWTNDVGFKKIPELKTHYPVAYGRR